MEEANIIKKVNEYITRYSGFSGVVVIMGWTIKVIVYITIITATIIKEGINSTIALVHATLCFVPYTTGRIRRRVKKTKVPPKDYPESVYMSPRESFIYSQAPMQ